MLGAPKVKSTAVVLSVSMVLGLGACGNGEDQPGDASANASGSASASGSAAGSASGSHAHGEAEKQFDKGEETATVHLTLKDFAFEGVPTEAKGENVLFEAEVTQGEHELEVLGADGKALGEIEPFKPDDGTKELALHLEPGTYTLQCLVEEGARTHKDLGMVAILVVT